MSDENTIDVDAVVLDFTPSATPAAQALVPFDKLPTEEQDQAFAAVELALMTGDYSRLSPQAKFAMVKRRCDILGVDMSQSPYQWGKDKSGKVMLIPVKNLYQQLRANKDIKLEVVEERVDRELGIYYLKIKALMANGREETDISAVSISNPDGGLMNGAGIANAMKVCWTQAKNRVTGSICAVGGMDESEHQASREAMLAQRLFEPDPNPQPRMITPGPGVEARQGLVAPRGGVPGGMQRATKTETQTESYMMERTGDEDRVVPTPTSPLVEGTVAAQVEKAKTLVNAAVAKPEKQEVEGGVAGTGTSKPAGASSGSAPVATPPVGNAPVAPAVPKKTQFVKAGGPAQQLGRPPKMQQTANPPAPKTPQPGPKVGG